MFDEQTPEIHEPEYPEEKRLELPSLESDETTDQVVASWFEDQAPVAPEELVPDEQYLTPTVDVPVEPVTDVEPVTMPGNEQSVQQIPLVDQVPAPTFDDVDLSTWCDDTPPEDWTDWSSPTDPSQDSWTDEGYSVDWGQVDATWPEEGGDLWTQTQTQTPLSDVVGPGHVADSFWGYQGETNYCVLYSAASILGEVYGQPIDMDEMVQRAEANSWLVRDADGKVLGINGENFDDLLASYGVPSHNVEGEPGAWETLNTALTNDQRVIVSVDSGEIDLGGNDETENDADHAIAVTGIDYARSVVIVNDSAREAGLEIPMQVFYDAWRDGNFHMTVTDGTLGAGEGAVPPEGTAGMLPDAPGFAVLPFTLHLPSLAPTLPEPRLS